MPTHAGRRRSPFVAAFLLLSFAANPALAQIPSGEYAARRDSLAARVHNGIVVAFGARTPVTDFGPFYQLPAFHYLTNFHEPDAALVMVVRDGRGTSTLFLTPIAPRRAFYYGKRPDSAEVVRSFGMRARTFAALGAVVDSLAGERLPFFVLDDFEDADFAAQDSLTRGKQFVRALKARHASGIEIRDAHPIVDELRARKSPAEMALLRKAAEISTEGHRAAMSIPEPTKEYEIQAALEGTFLRLGGARPSYGSIVGGGVHGTQLHYMRDRGDVKPGDVVVMDAATEYEGYAADITRTLPVSGKYTPEQRAIYQLVRDAQAAAERLARPGASVRELSDTARAVIARGLTRLGLIEAEDASFDPPWVPSCATTPAACRQSNLFYSHGLGHGIGLEVHDPAYTTGPAGPTLARGDAFTIEPGVYVNRQRLLLLPDTPRNRALVARVRAAVDRYHGIGVRIEDDYLVTSRGVERITSAPREVDEIERSMRRTPRAEPARE